MSSVPAFVFFLVIGLPIIGVIVLVGILIAISVSIAACVYFCKKSNQQSSGIIPGGPVMLVPVTAPVATTQDDSEKKEADTRQETESGTPQQGSGVVYPPQGVVFAPQQGPGGVVYPVPVGYSPQQGVVVVPQQGTTDTPQAAQELNKKRSTQTTK